MTQAYTEWLKRPESERNAEAGTVVMGWTLFWDAWKHVVNDSPKAWERQVEFAAPLEWSPCTDRNATDIVLAEVKRKGLDGRFADNIVAHLRLNCLDIEDTLDIVRTPASLLTWAACEACKKEES
jgi:hypothetical protein